MNSETSIGLLLVDDHPVTCEGLARELEAQGDITVTTLVGSVADGLALFQDTCPDAKRAQTDLVLADMHLPDGTAADLCRQLRASGCSARFLIYTGYDEDCDLWDALEAGAEGFIYKSADLAEIVQAVREVHAGRRLWTSEQLARAQGWWNEVGSKVAALTEREREVLALVAADRSNRDMAEALGVSERTVESHIRNLIDKVNVRSRVGLAAFYSEHCRGRNGLPKLSGSTDDKLPPGVVS
jgi:DNA-binding NarL/FixJ family response regulator